MRINNKNDLPKWFNLSDYDCYSIMPDDEIVYQLSCRWNALITEEYNNHEEFFTKKINKGLYVYNEYEGKAVWEREGINKSFCLSKKSSTSPLSVRDIRFITSNLKSENNIDVVKHVDDDFSDSYIHISAIDKVSVIFDGVFCKINLLKQDEIILYELSQLMKIWRRELDIPDRCSPIKNGWDVIKDKIISYAAMPLIDLILWEKATSNKITNGVLAVSLFPLGNYDSINIAQTIKPFIDSILDYQSIEKMEHEISNK